MGLRPAVPISNVTGPDPLSLGTTLALPIVVVLLFASGQISDEPLGKRL